MIRMRPMKTARKPRQARKPAAARKAGPRMPVILEDVPPGYDWGWHSREDPRMHLQVVDREHKFLKYKLWLESKGKRVCEPASEIPAKILKRVQAEVARQRESIEAHWVHLMIEVGWLTHAVKDE